MNDSNQCNIGSHLSFSYNDKGSVFEISLGMTVGIKDAQLLRPVIFETSARYLGRCTLFRTLLVFSFVAIYGFATSFMVSG